MKDNRRFETVGDVIGFLYDTEHAPAYGSPPWGRNGTKVVTAAIQAMFRGYTAEEVVAWLRSTTKVPKPINDDRLVFGEETDQHLWDRAREDIADYIESARKMSKRVVIFDKDAG